MPWWGVRDWVKCPSEGIGEGDEGEAILSRRRFEALRYMWSMEIVAGR